MPDRFADMLKDAIDYWSYLNTQEICLTQEQCKSLALHLIDLLPQIRQDAAGINDISPAQRSRSDLTPDEKRIRDIIYGFLAGPAWNDYPSYVDKAEGILDRILPVIDGMYGPIEDVETVEGNVYELIFQFIMKHDRLMIPNFYTPGHAREYADKVSVVSSELRDILMGDINRYIRERTKDNIKATPGEEIASGLTEFRDVLRSGEPIEEHFQIDTIVAYDKAKIDSKVRTDFWPWLTPSVTANPHGAIKELTGSNWPPGSDNPEPLTDEARCDLFANGAELCHAAIFGDPMAYARSGTDEASRIDWASSKVAPDDDDRLIIGGAGPCPDELIHPDPPHDPVNHPPHYNARPSGVEAIDICENMSFNLGNAVKYIFRAGLKGDMLEDLNKCVWYVKREIELLTKERGDT